MLTVDDFKTSRTTGNNYVPVNFLLLNEKIIYSKTHTTVCKTKGKQKTLLSIFAQPTGIILHCISSLKSLSMSVLKMV